MREVGYGVPDIDRAILSARNDVTMVAEAEIQPFVVGADGRSGVFHEMHFYDLPGRGRRWNGSRMRSSS